LKTAPSVLGSPFPTIGLSRLDNVRVKSENILMSKNVVSLSHLRAQKLIETGLYLVSQGKFLEAKKQFKKANQACESAESMTYWGWMEYQLGNPEKAILLCKKAIRIDPDLGNPYNDIGSYLVVLGKEDEAISWFEKAIRAKRYEARHYPHINLGRLFLKRNFPLRALQEFKKANEWCPTDPVIQEAIRNLTEKLH